MESWLFIHIVNLKKQNNFLIIYITMRSYRKPEIQNDLPKITQIKWICYSF